MNEINSPNLRAISGGYPMRKLFAALAVAAPFVVAGAAQAATGPWYAEVGYNRLSTASDVKVDLNAIQFRGGYQASPHWGAEMDVATGLGSGNANIGVTDHVKLDYLVGVYGVGYLPVAKGADFFVRVGAVGGQFSQSALGASASNHENGWAAGAGFRWFPKNGANGVRVEYTRYGMQDDVNTFGASFVHKF